MGIYVILSSSFNLIIGYGGLASVAHPIFFALGAYTTGLLAIGDQRRRPDSCLDVGFRAPGPEDAVRNQVQERGVNLANDRAADERERAAAASGN